MKDTQTITRPPTTGRHVLTRALDGLRTGEVEWGRTWYVNPRTGGRCLLGILAWAADEGDDTANPFLLAPVPRRAAREAMEAVLAVLSDRGALPPYPTTEHPDRVALVDERLEPLSLMVLGEWSDEQPNGLPVIEVLEAALERAA